MQINAKEIVYGVVDWYKETWGSNPHSATNMCKSLDLSDLQFPDL